MQIKCLTVGALQANCYIINQEGSSQALLLDPGSEADRIIAYLEDQGLELEAILLTHGHCDHIGALEAIRQYSQAAVYIHPAYQDYLLSAEKNLSALGFASQAVTCQPAEETFQEGKLYHLAGLSFEVFHTPGHTPGGVSLYFEDEGLLFSGDTLFRHSIGRTDLIGGDTATILKSIIQKLFLLPEETRVFPGHMGETTIAEEKSHNPFFKLSD
ncbi:MBL fold metallo-hydrolase [Aerococcus sp. HMSC06H08]|uniref:MBL fold metallo-hydrolase n=1 Tax=Aerococcus sp. HMSC06H08 TaxID=1581129 RepID=UPI0008A49818|nr:MBL fold metallo-hydrolase [Aerococcus sp. HMSC06H08]OFT40955.1 hypothetical protein HMPREF3161_03895 [Aerococcus sp. HMSC06H08]